MRPITTKVLPDGVGNVCKRTADRLVSLGKDLSTLTSLSTVIEDNCPGIKTYIANDDAIEKMSSVIKRNKKSIFLFSGTL